MTVKSKKAFTLIELLVVVLIIGILAAVALPQYQVAVGKAKFTELLAIGDAIHKAEELYYLENGEYTDNIDNLTISVPSTSHIATIDLVVTSSDAVCTLRYANFSPYYVFYFDHHPAGSYYSGKRECRVKNVNLTAANKQICASVTGDIEHTGSQYSSWIFPK